MSDLKDAAESPHKSGYVKLHRSLEDSAVFENPLTLKVFLWCLMRANYTARQIRFHGESITLRPGQFITGRFAGAEACSMAPSTFRNQIARLHELDILDSASDNKKTISTVINWARYQGEAPGQDSTEDSKKDNEETLFTLEERPDSQREVLTEDSKKDNGRTTGGHRQEGKKERKKISHTTTQETAARIYEHYATSVRAGARTDAIRSITRLLEDHSPEELIGCIDRYAGNGMPKDSQYRLQANNFFGKAARYQEYTEDAYPVQDDPHEYQRIIQQRMAQ